MAFGKITWSVLREWEKVFCFYPTALKGCWGIVFTYGVRMGGRPVWRAGGRAAGKSLSGLYLRNRKV